MQHFIERYSRYSRYRTKSHDKATISNDIHDIARNHTIKLRYQTIFTISNGTLKTPRDNQTTRVDKLACQRVSADCSAMARKMGAKCVAPSGNACIARSIISTFGRNLQKMLCVGRAFFVISWRTMNCPYGHELANAMNCTPAVHELPASLMEWAIQLMKSEISNHEAV